MAAPVIKRPIASGRQSLDKRLEIEAEGGDDIHYHFHGPAQPLGGLARGDDRARDRPARRRDEPQGPPPDWECSVEGCDENHSSGAFPMWIVWLILGLLAAVAVASKSDGSQAAPGLLLFPLAVCGFAYGISKLLGK